MEISVALSGGRPVATHGEQSLILPSTMAFLAGVGPQRIEGALRDALRGKYALNEDELKIVKRWLR